MLLPALASFHSVALALERLNRQLALVDDANLERAQTTSRRTAEKAARQRLFNIYDLPVDRDADAEDTSLADALQIIGRHEGIEFKIPVRSGPSDSPIGLVDILDASGVRAPARAIQGRGGLVARRQQRVAGIPRRRRPARRAAARKRSGATGKSTRSASAASA